MLQHILRQSRKRSSGLVSLNAIAFVSMAVGAQNDLGGQQTFARKMI